MTVLRYFLSLYFIFSFSSLYPQTRIIGGREIRIEDAPWTVNIRIVNTLGIRLFDRSGVIVSENMILTASHDWPDYEYDHLSVHAGGTYGDTGEYYRVHRVIHHPVWDLTLLILSEPLVFNSCIRSIDYRSCADESLYVPGTLATVYGWGATVPNAPATSLRFRSVDVTVISKEEADSVYGACIVPENTVVTRCESQICMAGKGDSGGPLVVFDDQQRAILAGITCLADTREESQNSGLTIYAKVKPVIEWIDRNRCEISGADVVYPLGATFRIDNLPPDVKSVEWIYSGLTEINSTMNHTEVVSSDIDSETAGSVSAMILADCGSITVTKNLQIMPRIDIDIRISYNAIVSKYEMKVKTVNMGTFDSEDNLKCKNVYADVNVLGFIWTHENETAIGNEAIFEINPYSPKVHRISVCRHACDHTLRLEKTFVIQCRDNNFISVYNEPGTITLGCMNLFSYSNIEKKMEMRFSKNDGESVVSLNTSDVIMENRFPTERIAKSENYKVLLYSRDGRLLYENYFDPFENSLHINTSAFHSDIYILNVCDLDNNNSTSRQLIIY
jgi:hypothetical protein